MYSVSVSCVCVCVYVCVCVCVCVYFFCFSLYSTKYVLILEIVVIDDDVVLNFLMMVFVVRNMNDKIHFSFSIN
jgi:hypothetical protein